MAGESGCAGVVRSDLPTLSQGAAQSALLDDELRAILEYASLAPSGHNAQPWEVRLASSRRLFVASVRERWLPAVDPSNRETLLSLGAFVENLVLAAGARSLEATVDVVATKPTDLVVLDVSLQAGKETPYPLGRLRSRKTLRTELATAPLDAPSLDTLTKAAGELVYAPRGHADCTYLDEVTIEANRQQAFRDPAQEELTSWVRWSNEEVRQKRDGLSLEALEVTGVVGWAARTFMNKRSLLSKSARERTVDTTRKQVAHSGGWLVLSSNDESVAALIDCGRRFQRMQLLMRELGIGAQPMSQALEEQPFRDNLVSRLGIRSPQLLLRVGRAKVYGEPVSVRRDVGSFVRFP